MKALAIIGGIVLGLLICVVGFAMVGPGGPHAFVIPVRLGLAAIVALPAGYFFLVRPVAPSGIGAAFMIVMLGALVLSWLPLWRDEVIYNMHLDTMIIWSILWFVATMPFIRTAFRR